MHGDFPWRSFFRVAYTRRRSCSLDGRRGVNRCDGFSAGRAIEIQEAKIAAALLSTNGGIEINAKQLNFLRITAIFDSEYQGEKDKLYLHINFCVQFFMITSSQLFPLNRFFSDVLIITFHCPEI